MQFGGRDHDLKPHPFHHHLRRIGAGQRIGTQNLRHEISPREAEASLRQFDENIPNGVFLLRPLSEQVFQRARPFPSTTSQLGTRTADLLQLAAALELGAQMLYSFDQQQRKLAKAIRLKLN